MPFRRYPDSSVFYRKLTRSYPVIVRGEGCWLIDADGRRYLDACGGAFVVNIGHGVAEIGDAMASQARALRWSCAVSRSGGDHPRGTGGGSRIGVPASALVDPMRHIGVVWGHA